MSEKAHEITLFRIGGWPAMVIYVGIGALLHALIVGPQFDWSSAWTWGWLLGWPIALFIAFWAFILGGFVVAIFIGLSILGFEKYRDWRSQKELRALIKQQRERARVKP